MKLNENNKMTVYMVGSPNQAYEIEKPSEMSFQGWQEFASLFPDNEKLEYETVIRMLNELCFDIIDNKDTGKDLVHSLQLVIVKKLFQIREIQNLIKNSVSYKNGEITDLIVDTII